MTKLLSISLLAAALTLSLQAQQQQQSSGSDFGLPSASNLSSTGEKNSGGGPKRLFGKDDDKSKKELPPPDENNKHDLAKETKVDSILASVNGDPITLLDVLLESSKEEARLAALFTGERLYSETAKLRRKIVDENVDRKLVYALYKDKPFDIDKQIVEDMVDAIAQSMGDGTRKGLEKRSKALGITLDEIREKAKERIADDVLMAEYCDRQVYVTPKDVFDYYQSHLQDWITPEALELQLLLVKRDGGRSGLSAKETCEMIWKSIEGADEERFSALARNYSDGPNASTGGRSGAIERSKLRPEFEKALKDVKKSISVGPIETPEGFYFIRVSEIVPAVVPEFGKVERDIRKKLEDSAKDVKRAKFLQDLRDKAIVRYYF